MPSNKPKVISYLETSEKAVFDKFCDDNDYSNSQGVAHLIREQLGEKKKVVDIDEEKVKLLAKSIMPLEQIQKSAVQASLNYEKIEKLEAKITKLELLVEAVDKLQRNPSLREFSDQDIAAIVRQPVEKVYLWRTGWQKPRGRRIKEKLRPFEVVHGQWRLREKIA